MENKKKQLRHGMIPLIAILSSATADASCFINPAPLMQVLFDGVLLLAVVAYITYTLAYLRRHAKEKSRDRYIKGLLVITAIALVSIAGIGFISWATTLYIPIIPSIVNNYLDCQVIDYSPIKERCYYNLAMKKEDPIICNKLAVDSYYGDYGPCQTTGCGCPHTPSRWDCLIDVAKKTKDLTICDEIDNQQAKGHCLAAITKNSSLCEKIEGSKRQDCLRDST